MHVDVAVGAKLSAFATADAPIFNDDFEVLFPPNGADRALGHAKRVAARSTCGGDQEMFVTQTVAKESRNSVMRLRTGADARVAPRAVLEIDQQKILCFEQSLAQKIVEMQSRRDRFLLIGRETRAGDRFDLLTHRRKFFQHQCKIGRRNFDHIDRIERSAGGGAFDRPQQSNFAEIIATT